MEATFKLENSFLLGGFLATQLENYESNWGNHFPDFLRSESESFETHFDTILIVATHELSERVARIFETTT